MATAGVYVLCCQREQMKSACPERLDMVQYAVMAMVIGSTGDHLSFVDATGSGCLIHRETTGRYVVSHEAVPDGRLHAEIGRAHV